MLASVSHEPGGPHAGVGHGLLQSPPMLPLTTSLAAALLLAPLAVPQASPDAAPAGAPKAALVEFVGQLQEASSDYALTTSANTALLLEGDLATATRKLLEAVPEGERTAAHDFVLGNLLYAMEP